MTYTEEELRKIWNQGEKIPGRNEDIYRKDSCGNIIYWSSYGKETPMGWEVDHKHPKAKGGSDKLSNLQPLQSSENASKGQKYPY